MEDSSASNLPATSEPTTVSNKPSVPTTSYEPPISSSQAFYDNSLALDNSQFDNSTRQHIYVATTGSDTASGSASSPILTLQRAADLATAGTTVHIAAGSYKGPVYIKNSGTLAKPIIFQPMQAAKIIITGTPSEADEHLFHIENQAYVIIRGLEFTNFWTNNEQITPTAIYVTGSSHNLLIENNYIHDLGTRVNNDKGNAHGIAIYGTQPIKDIQINNNRVENLSLGRSEAVVINGDVTNFEVNHNQVNNNNNIGIDIIGFEGTAKTDNDYARRGDIIGNTVTHNSISGNPGYEGEDPSAGGIYVDGGKQVFIQNNTVANNDVGIEVASENFQKLTEDVWVESNTVTNSTYAGLAVGGYDEQRGGVRQITLVNNTVANNDLGKQQGGQLLMQFNIQKLAIKDNTFTSSPSGYMIIANQLDRGEVSFQNNRYLPHNSHSSLIWVLGNKEFNSSSAFENCAVLQQCK
ncbi:right-handed parallel beta-helix repeat-containing protein [Psychrobacter sp. UBA3962]|uniref:right-handed parallel beta-helix repeat-containing protein n=1 Tax=Psychrobacter sp. UBA3962 TaxID=1947352 RepID=UPI0025D8DACF|nr:right-handed parallel beta-helix repeat-containing protein [Psychrobacter sp. UBA3962]